MVTILYNGANDAIRAAVTYVNNLFIYTPFLDAIYTNKHFDMADIPPKKIVDMIDNTDLQLSVNLYWPLPNINTAYAYDDPQNPLAIHMNKMALNRPVHSLCNTMVHQCVHALNIQNPSCYFGHGDNNPTGKNNTAPFWIAGLAQKFVAEDDKIYEPMYHEDINNIPLIQNSNTRQIQDALHHEGIFCVYDMIAILETE